MTGAKRLLLVVCGSLSVFDMSTIDKLLTTNICFPISFAMQAEYLSSETNLFTFDFSPFTKK